MKQQSLASQGVFEKYGRKSRRELFLEEMEGVVPWSALESLVRPHYAKAGNGRQPVGLSIMLRTYFVQQWFNLSDPGVEEALYESAALRRFVGVDLGVAPAPDETTVCRLRHVLEKNDLGGLMLEAVNVHLEAKGIRIATGHDRGCDHYPRALLHQEPVRRARPGDAPDQEGEAVVLRSEGAYRGGQQRGRGAFGLYVRGFGGRQAYAARPAARRRAQGVGRRRLSGPDGGHPRRRATRAGPDLPQTKFKNYVDEEAKRKNTTKSKVRAKVEHVFRILKRVFGFDRVRYRGIAKNHHRLCANFALINLYLHRKRLAVLGA